MGVIQAIAHAGDNTAGVLDGNLSAGSVLFLDQMLNVPPRDVLHGDVIRVVCFPEVINLNDVGMTQLRSDASLVEEHRHKLFVRGQV